ncbi:MAG: hypothetical protein ABFD54_05975 [Armatimonadota bacterium]|nr:hypothetical protein [bacterium]
MTFYFGCKWTFEYFATGLVGGLVATLILPGSYTTLPRLENVEGEVRLYWGVFARLIAAGVFGCIVDCNNRNAFFGGFFSWHVLRWMSEEGWILLKTRLKAWFSKD